MEYNRSLLTWQHAINDFRFSRAAECEPQEAVRFQQTLHPPAEFPSHFAAWQKPPSVL
jgi:hypothetical protein